MATNLKKTDVVIVGLGAAGGVAALPLARAGLDVVGLEAGTWLTNADFAPDELRNNFRAWPQAVQKANREIPTHRPNASAPYSPRPDDSPDDERRRGHHAALLGAELAPQSVGLQGRERDDAPIRTRRGSPAARPSRTGRSDSRSSSRTTTEVEYELGVSGQAGNINGKIVPGGNIFEGPRKRDYPMPPLRGTGFTDMMAEAREDARVASVPGSGGHQFAKLPESRRLRLPRLLQPWRLSRERERRRRR